MKRSCLMFAFLTVICTGLLGCGAGTGLKGTCPVTGTVTQKGAPLAGTTVTFVPSTQGARASLGGYRRYGQVHADKPYPG